LQSQIYITLKEKSKSTAKTGRKPTLSLKVITKI